MYALVDCNNFYCSCERVFQPTLNGKPVVVLSNNDGCVIARSEEAKQIGIVMGAPEHLMRSLIDQHQVTLFSSNYTLYGDMSERVMKSLAGFVPHLEIYSIDEAFLDLRAMRHIDLLQLATTLRQTVFQHTGIPVSVGIAPTKTLAKLANRYAKKFHKDLGVHYLANQHQINQALAATPVNDIWGIGANYARLLEVNGFKTAFDLAQAPPDWVRQKMSVVGLRLRQELNGMPCQPGAFEPPKKKNIATTRSFGKITDDRSLLEEAIANHTATAAAKLRKQNSCARQLQVLIQTNIFRQQDQQYSHQITLELEVPTNDSPELIKYALKGLDLIFQPGYKYNKCGVLLLNLVDEAEGQRGLFDTRNRQKQRQMAATIDQLNHAFGKDMVRFAVQGFERRYRLRAKYLSNCYTTRLNEILHVRI